MGKPVLGVTISTVDGKRRKVDALFDTGSFHTLVRADCFPKGGAQFRYPRSRGLTTAGRKGGVRIVGITILVVGIGKKRVQSPALISPDLRREMIVGAETMQAWDITIRNRNGSTRVVVGRDMRDRDVIEVA